MTAFAGLAGFAALLDLAAVALGASAACFSPAYAFLLPAYAVLWWAGRWAAKPSRAPMLVRILATGSFATLLSLCITGFALAPRRQAALEC